MKVLAFDAQARAYPCAADAGSAARLLGEMRPDAVLVAPNGWGAALAASLPAERRPAVIVVGDRPGAHVFDDWVNDARELSERLRLAVARSRDRRRAARRALVDPLTQLANRRGAIRGLMHGAARARRDGSPVSILLLDLDHFKAINDTFGHDEGDRVLRRVGGVLAGVVRREEVAARIGGDEFAVVALCSLRDARAVARRIQDGLAREGIRASIAAGELRSGERLRDFYRRTDEMLRAKKVSSRSGHHVAA